MHHLPQVMLGKRAGYHNGLACGNGASEALCEREWQPHEWQPHAAALAAVLAHEVNAKPGGAADGHACRVEQVAQHAAPRLLAARSRGALQPVQVSDMRVAQKNGSSKSRVAKAWKETLGGGGVESAGACGAGDERNLVRQIWEGALGKRLGH